MTRRNVLLLGLVLALALIFYKTQRPRIDSAIEAATQVIEGDVAVPVGKLSREVVPTNYDLALTIIPERDYFEGQTSIQVLVSKPLSRIWLHGDQLDVQEAYITDSTGRRIGATYEQVDKTGVAKLTLAEQLPAGEATLYFQYKAPFNRALEGLYKVVENGTPYAFTQFQATSARLAFPGFDEPAFKVPFDIALTVPQESVAVTNTPLIRVKKLDAGLKQIRFARTKPLPTYLLAFVVGDLDVVEWAPIPATEERGRTIPLRGITARGKGDQIRYALEHTADMVLSQENYFNKPYPYAKLDIIAAPDFAAGAMENAGAIIYREQLMLFNENPSLAQKRRYAVVHAHELAHQWFGDLVTPVWWDDLWLNESFASWMESKTIHELRPNEQYGRNTLRDALGAMSTDSLISARQIQQPINSNRDIGSAFDAITYEKGGGVLAMFESFVGEEAFREGNRLHMKRHAFGVATADDYLQSLADGSGKAQVVPAFKSFLQQPGVPLVNVDWSCSRAEDKTARIDVQLLQKRYLPLGSSGSADRLWQIPVCLVSVADGERARECALVTRKSQTVTLKAQACPAAVMPNADGAGYFRWTMPKAKWQALLGQMEALNASEALSLEDSLWAAVLSGEAQAETYFKAAAMLAQRDAWDVAASPMGGLSYSMDKWLKEDARAAARSYFSDIYKPLFARLGLSGDGELDQADPVSAALLRRPVVWFLAFEARDADVRQSLTGLGKAYIGFDGDNRLHAGSVNPDIVGEALSVSVQELGAPYIDALMKIFDGSTDAVLRENILRALTYTQDPETITRVQGLMLSPELRDNEVVRILYGLASHEETRAPVWEWLKQNIDQLLPRIPKWRQGDLPGVAAGFCSKERKAEVSRFFESRVAALDGGKRSLENTLEQIDLCIAAKTAHAGKANDWFLSRQVPVQPESRPSESNL